MEMEKSERLSKDQEPIPTERLPGERATMTSNVHLGSVRKMNAEAALLKARWMKGECAWEHYLFNTSSRATISGGRSSCTVFQRGMDQTVSHGDDICPRNCRH